MSKHSKTPLTGSRKKRVRPARVERRPQSKPQTAWIDTQDAMTLRPDYPDALDERVLSCAFGHYPWDDWEEAARVAGVPGDLAGLGRLTMREAYQHQWSDRLKSLCGWRDEGRRMTRLALRSPGTAEKRWQRLLDTDGYRGQYNEKTGQWVSWL